MRWRTTMLAGFCVLLPVACSVVDDGKVRRLDPPDELTDTLPTTTTTLPATTTTGLETTTTALETTTTALPSESVFLYYISGGQLNPFPSQLPTQYAMSQLIALLQAGPTDSPLAISLRSAIPREVEIRASPDGTGVAQVVLPEGFFDTIPASDQRLAIAQIVMTLLRNVPGIGQVAFNLQVSGPAGEVISPGQLLTSADYASLLASSTTPTSVATTSTPPAAQDDTSDTVAA